jgi:hypothetical protein
MGQVPVSALMFTEVTASVLAKRKLNNQNQHLFLDSSDN